MRICLATDIKCYMNHIKQIKQLFYLFCILSNKTGSKVDSYADEARNTCTTDRIPIRSFRLRTISSLMCMGKLTFFLLSLQRETTLVTSHLLCWTENPFQLGETLFSLRVDPIQKEGKIENGRVASHERILIHLKDTEG